MDDPRHARRVRRGSEPAAAVFRRAVRLAEAWCALAVADVLVSCVGFERFYKVMSSWPTIGSAPSIARARVVRETCTALDGARLYYFKRAWCLQGAAAAVCLMRLRGVPAAFEIGVRKMPFAAHAWATVDGAPVGLEAEEAKGYRVITRC